MALANLTSGQVQNSVEIGDRNGVEPLIGLLSSTREATQANAAQVLTNMATDEILRADIQKKGVVGALIDPLHSRFVSDGHVICNFPIYTYYFLKLKKKKLN